MDRYKGLLTKLTSHSTLKPHTEPPTHDTRVITTCNASNDRWQRDGLATQYTFEHLFQSAESLPVNHMLDPQLAALESSLTDTEKFGLVQLALQPTKLVPEKYFPNLIHFPTSNLTHQRCRP